MSAPEMPPAALREAVLRDLRPVQPLRAPFLRAVPLFLLAVLSIALQPALLGVRGDASALGVFLLWGLSAGQWLLGCLLLAAALREAVPGRSLPLARSLLVLAVLLVVLVTTLTAFASATTYAPRHFRFFWMACFAGSTLIGAPLLGLAVWLALRAYPLRPSLVGALAGLGAGLVSDAGWRTFCHIADPRHVLSAHGAAVAALGAGGALLATFLWRRRR